jgi:hypothetical protein
MIFFYIQKMGSIFKQILRYRNIHNITKWQFDILNDFAFPIDESDGSSLPQEKHHSSFRVLKRTIH